MTIWEALILGVVEGITEYLPVSSTGHLIVTSHLLGLKEGRALNAFTIAIQFGAIMAVLGIYHKKVAGMIRGVFREKGFEQEAKLAFLIVTAFIPAAILGSLFNDMIELYLFGIKPVIFSWFVGGLAILIVTACKKKESEKDSASSPKKSLYELTYSEALIIGFAQCIAMWPGTSRSLVTILAGWIIGLSLTAAVEFSFLLGVVTLTAAACYTLVKNGQTLFNEIGMTTFLVGLISAGISAWLAVKGMINYLNKHGFAVFGWYRIAIALLTLGLIISGNIPESNTDNSKSESQNSIHQTP